MAGGVAVALGSALSPAEIDDLGAQAPPAAAAPLGSSLSLDGTMMMVAVDPD